MVKNTDIPKKLNIQKKRDIPKKLIKIQDMPKITIISKKIKTFSKFNIFPKLSDISKDSEHSQHPSIHTSTIHTSMNMRGLLHFRRPCRSSVCLEHFFGGGAPLRNSSIHHVMNAGPASPLYRPVSKKNRGKKRRFNHFYWERLDRTVKEVP